MNETIKEKEPVEAPEIETDKESDEREILAAFNDQVQEEFKKLKMDLDFDLYTKIKDCVNLSDPETSKASLEKIITLIKAINSKASSKRIQQAYTPQEGKAVKKDFITEAFKPPKTY